ncbi:MAG: NUDIX hydrolase [Candidatus Moraniibacteriota bacterium]
MNFFQYCPQCGFKVNKECFQKNVFSCPQCHCKQYFNPKPVVLAFIRSGNEIILAKRGIRPYKGYWGMPGGFVNYGESPEAALHRELKEELGVKKCKINKMLATYHEWYVFGKERLSLNVTIFQVSLSPGSILQSGDDAAEIGKFPLRSLPPRIAFPGQRRFFSDLTKR